MASTPKSGSKGFNLDQMSKRVQYGMDHGGPMGAMMGFMGLPYLSRGGGSDSAPHGSGPAPFQKMWPGGTDPNMGGGGSGNGQDPTLGGNDPTTGGNGPAVDPAKLGALGKVNGFPQWYIDWYNSQGKYGGVPQVSGLLNG